MWSGLESRKFPRIKTNCRIFIQDQEKKRSIESLTENLGAGGLCVILDQALERMSKVKIELDLKDGKNSIGCDGRIVWAVRKRSFNPSEQGYDVGIEFINLSSENTNRLNELINRSAIGTK